VLTGLGLSRPGAGGPPADDVPTALEQARAALGQRPAITVRHAPAGGEDSDGSRREQGFASLAGWVAKGAHLVRDELGLGPGDELGLAGPACWPVAAVALAAWWVGVTLIPAEAAEVAVVHTGSEGATAAGATLLWVGDAMDGTGTLDPSRPWGEWWTEAVIPFPDRPPTPARDGGLAAVRTATGAISQRALLAATQDAMKDASGVLGLLRRPSGTATIDADELALLALRPLVTGSATVVLADIVTDPLLARIVASERISAWAPRG
jgi:hypothetical protein